MIPSRTPEERKHKSERKKLKAWSRIKRGPKGDVRVGKTGTVRLKGKAMEDLRNECFLRDDFKCQECGLRVSWSGFRDFGNYPQTPSFSPRGEMAHIKSRGAGGPDTLDNVRTLCQDCHRLEHAGGKPCPARER